MRGGVGKNKREREMDYFVEEKIRVLTYSWSYFLYRWVIFGHVVVYT